MSPFCDSTTASSHDRDIYYFRGGVVYVISATTTTGTTSTTRVSYGYTDYTATTNYPIYFEPLPKCETDSAIQLARMAAFGINPLRMAPVRKPSCSGSARAFRHRPRGKLRYWRSLKEKRLAWGIS